MSPSFRWVILSGAILVAALVALRWVDTRTTPSIQPLPVIREVGAFSVTNHHGRRLESIELRGRPWAVNLFFSRCPGPCAQLSGVMRTVQDRLQAMGSASTARLLSITSDPEFDTPEVLTAYGSKFGADADRWQWVTGTKGDIHRLATEEFLLVLQEKEEALRETPEDLFLHSTLIVVLDTAGRLRGAVEGLEPGAAEKVVTMLRQLEP